MKLILTKDQLEKFEVIKWLTDPFGHRGSGRTQVLAYAYIDHAIKYGAWIEIKNHNSHLTNELKNRISEIMGDREGFCFSIKRQGNSISIRIKQSELPPYKNNPYLTKEDSPCGYCDGKGFVISPSEGQDPCPSCKGTCLEYNPPPGRGRKCGNCRGKGYLDNEIDTCMCCEGTGYLKLMKK